MAMERLKKSIATTIEELTDADDADARMEDMSEFILSPYEGSVSMDSEEAAKDQILVKASKPRNPKAPDDQELMDSIDAAYFIEDDFDAIDYELKKMHGLDLNLDDLDRERMKLKSQLTVISKKISVLIMEKSPSYSSQLEDMTAIQHSIKHTLKHVMDIRKSLALVKSQSRNSIGILANEKKKHLLRRLKNTLLTIKTLYETEYQLKEHIQDGQFPIAIQLCMHAKDAANTYKHFSCVYDLMSKLAGMGSLIESELYSALSSLTVNFDLDRYIEVYSAFVMLGKQELVCRKLIQALISTVDGSSRAILEERSRNGPQENSTKSFEQLCQNIDNEDVLTTLRELGFVVCRALIAYHAILRYHSEEEDRVKLEDGQDKISVQNGKDHSVLSSLLSSKDTIFSTALEKFTIFIQTCDFAFLKFDSLLDIVDMANRFTEFGKTYFLSESSDLISSVEKQIVTYFQRYHKERMDELAMFIENEIFTLCPVPYQFTIFDLQDFLFLKEERHQKSSKGDEINDLKDQNTAINFTIECTNPFSIKELRSRHQSAYSVGTSNSNSVRQSVDNPDDQAFEEEKDDPAHIPPNICNTALNLLRFFGRYMRITALLPSVCDKSIPAVTELFELFFISICTFFGQTDSNNDRVEKPKKLDVVLQSIQSRLLPCTSESSPRKSSSIQNHHHSLISNLPHLNPAVQIGFPDQLFGLLERIIAIDSLEFVARQLDLMRPVIESLIPVDDRSAEDNAFQQLESNLEEFYSKILSSVGEVRLYILDCVASCALKLSHLQTSVANTKWDTNQLHSQHSQYVDFLLKDLEAFNLRLDTITFDSPINFSKETRNMLWDRVIYYAFKTLVQGYCDGGKCSTEGRALMQLDFQQLLVKLEPLCGIKPIPHADYVDGYIKAFYLPENGLEQWINQHTEYTAKQVISLLGVASHVSKKAKTRIINALND